MPPTQTCMNCHSQIWRDSPTLEPVRASWQSGKSIEWTRVYDLPGYVYFDHSIHVAKGVGCSTCHGDVTQMNVLWQAPTLHMEWCLDCHREPERFLRPRERIFDMSWESPADQLDLGLQLLADYDVQPSADCSVCHR